MPNVCWHLCNLFTLKYFCLTVKLSRSCKIYKKDVSSSTPWQNNVQFGKPSWYSEQAFAWSQMSRLQQSAEMCNLEEDTEYILYWTSVFLQVAVYLVFCWLKITLTLPPCNTFFVFTESVIWIVVPKNQLLLHDSWGQRVERKFGF